MRGVGDTWVAHRLTMRRCAVGILQHNSLLSRDILLPHGVVSSGNFSPTELMEPMRADSGLHRAEEAFAVLTEQMIFNRGKASKHQRRGQPGSGSIIADLRVGYLTPTFDRGKSKGYA